MYHKILLLSSFLFSLIIANAQPSVYQGKLKVNGIETDNDISYAENNFNLTVGPDGKAVCTINLRLISAKDPGDYLYFAGTFKGQYSNNSLTASGNMTESMKQGKHSASEVLPAEIKGSGTENNISGTVFITIDGKKQDFLTFGITLTELVPTLLFPLGESPKVFNKGWLFGARFVLIDEKGVELDLSDKIEWSGTAKFEPLKGATNSPIFKSVGENKIILTVLYGDKKYKKEYPVNTVEATDYARVSSIASCPADAHGGPADPMSTKGPIISGNSKVLIEGLPAACEGDKGIHAACAGANTFWIAGGDPEVLIEGKKAAKLNTPTQHCGGMGKITHLGVRTYGSLYAYSKDVIYSKEEWEKIVTGAKGMVMMRPDQQTLVTLLPNSKAAITDTTGNNYFIGLTEGSVMVNGVEGEKKKNLVVETEQEKLIRKGTRYLFTHTANSSKLIVYEGAVEVHLKKDNSVILVPAGKSYTNDFTSPYIIKDTIAFESSPILATIPKDGMELIVDDIPETEEKEKSNSIIDLAIKYWYVGAGLLVLIIMLVMFRKRKS